MRRSLSARPTPFGVRQRCVQLDFCFPLPSNRAPSSRGLPMALSRSIGEPGFSRSQDRFGGPLCFSVGRCLPAACRSAEPLAPLTASVSARLDRCRPAARESMRSALRPEAPFIGRDPLLANLRRRRESHVKCSLRRLTTPFHPRIAARALRRFQPPRARSPATPAGPSLLARSPATASLDPTPPSDFCNRTTRGRTHASRRSSPAV